MSAGEWVDDPTFQKDGGEWVDDPTFERGPSELESAARGVAQGATLGFADEISGGVEALWNKAKGDPAEFSKLYEQYRNESRSNFKKAKEANPASFTAGEIGGGVATALLPLGSAATLGRAIGTGVGLGAASGLGTSEAEDASGMAKDAAFGAAIGGAAGGLGYGAGKLIDKATPYLDKGAKTVGEALKLNKRADADAVAEAAKRLGVKPTPGMLYDDEVIRGLESSLSQSPSIPGMLTRKGTQPVEKALDKVASESLTDASSLSPFQIGERVKSGLDKSVEGRFAPSRAVFDDIAESSANIAPSPKSLERVAKNIATIDEVRIAPSSSWGSKALQYGDMLKKAESVKDITTVRKLIGADLEAARKSGGPEKYVLSSLYDRATRLEENSLMRGAVETMRGFARSPTGKTGEKMAQEGAEIGNDLVSQLRGAKKDFRTGMNDLREVADAARIKGAKSPSSFMSKIDDIRSENVADKLFNVDDVNLMRTMQSKFPEQAGLLRQGQLGDIKLRSSLSDGSLSTPKFFQNVKSLGDESKDILFGQGNVGRIGDAKTVMQALPEYVGPSGTPKGMEYLDMLNPVKAASDFGRYALYKGATSDTTQKVADFLLKRPAMQKLAESNPSAFRAVVLDFSRRFERPNATPRAAQNDPSELDADSSTSSQERVDESEARKQFLQGN